MQEAFAEVKRTRPKTFAGKYLGAVPMAARTLKGIMPDALGIATIDAALPLLKKAKTEPVKANVTGLMLECHVTITLVYFERC